jgi:hypothetical protein
MILIQVFLYPASSQPLPTPFKTLRSSIKSLKNKIKVDDTVQRLNPTTKHMPAREQTTIQPLTTLMFLDLKIAIQPSPHF